jgi:hypothetical protein
MACIALNMLCVGLGTHKPHLRVIGAGFALCLCFAHFVILIATAVYRFQTVGMLCGLSTAASNISAESVDADWTYEKDGKLIVICFII